MKTQCPHCHISFNAPDTYAGKWAKCPNCKQLLEITSLENPEKPVEYQDQDSVAFLQLRNDQRSKECQVKTQRVNREKTSTIVGFFLFVLALIIFFLFSNRSDKNIASVSRLERSVYHINEDVIVGDVRWRLIQSRNRGSILRRSESHAIFFREDKKTDGKFIEITMEVENLSTQLKSVTSRRLVDNRGRQFIPASDVDNWIPSDQEFFLSLNLNPNMPKIFSNIFEIPADANDLMIRVGTGREETLIRLGF